MHPMLNIEPIAEPYWQALANGELHYQHCEACGAAQLPARFHCTTCLSTNLKWTKASGDAELISWIVYHVPYHEYFKDKVPYNVAVVRLDEGPNLVTNIIDPDYAALKAGTKLTLTIQEEEGVHLARFRAQER